MILFQKIRLRLIYRILYPLIPKADVLLPENLKSSRNIFLYFDYEREFSGHKTAITDNEIESLLRLLKRFSVKCTWFTVGQIFEKYPRSVESVIRNGHEIASHSYYHRPPVDTKKSSLLDDFKMTQLKAPVNILGFHSPKSQWSLRCLAFLADFGYNYDLLTNSPGNLFSPFRYRLPRINKIIRFITAGDDWDLYMKNKSKDEVLDHFKKLFYKIKPGTVSGIGFHPWVLFSDSHIYEGFSEFLEFLLQQEGINISTAGEFTSLLTRDNNK